MNKKEVIKIYEDLKSKGFDVNFDVNFSNNKILEIQGPNGDFVLSYLPHEEINWCGNFGEEDMWGWGILNQIDGYLVDDKSYQDNSKEAVIKFIELIK